MKLINYAMSNFKYVNKLSNSVRHTKLIDKASLWKHSSIKYLTASRMKNKAGRNRSGMVVCFTKGSSAKNRLRNVTYLIKHYQVPCTILRIEHDPVRSGLIALARLANHICQYILCAYGINVGDIVTSYADIRATKPVDLAVLFNIGDSSRIISMPRGVTVHNVERYVGIGGSIARAGGSFSTLLYKFNVLNSCLLKIPSGLQFSITGIIMAVKGIVSNMLHKFRSIGKAGRNRLLGNKSIVRGVAMNPVDHPHGGGEGKKSKKCVPRTAWGKMLFWRKTGVFYNVQKIIV
jgi:large subunit ribosomal protein L2